MWSGNEITQVVLDTLHSRKPLIIVCLSLSIFHFSLAHKFETFRGNVLVVTSLFWGNLNWSGAFVVTNII
jgi:hypothetical protein